MHTILVIDIGNTTIKWGLHDGSKWILIDNASDVEWLMQPTLPVTPNLIVACCVGDEASLDHVDALAARLGITAITVTPHEQAYGVINGYERPEALGADRWVGLVAARQAYEERALLIVDAGTAVTIDHLDEAGFFCGGAIFPGLSVMKLSLIEHTTNLTLDTGSWQMAPKNTADAITTGCIDAIIGAVERNYQRMLERTPDLLCLITGGDATALLPYFQIPVCHAENLVLDGLRYIGHTHLEALCESW